MAVDVYVGTSGFAYREWKGSFYPKSLPASGMLQFYAGCFRSVEINNTFYQIPKPAVVAAWAGDVPEGFKFAIKVPQQITHRRQLEHAGDTMPNLINTLVGLKKQMGPLLFQLPPWLKKDVVRLREFFAMLPPQRRAAFEFRHPSWFDDEVFDMLRKQDSALCIANVENDLDVPFISTADWGYLRLRRLDYGDSDLRAWAKRICRQKWKEAFVYFRHEDTGKGPQFARRFLDLCKGQVA